MLKTVKTENGYVRGIPAADPRVISFKGIPFAAPPVGDLRWRAPQPAKDWEGVRDCLEFAPISMQSIPGCLLYTSTTASSIGFLNSRMLPSAAFCRYSRFFFPFSTAMPICPYRPCSAHSPA